MGGRIGLVVNPVAGLGGSVALKGSDGDDILAAARRLGAVPQASLRAAQALRELAGAAEQPEVLTFAGAMGEEAVRAAGLQATICGAADGEPSTAADTRRAALELQRAGVEILLFAGGDGTARDVCAAVGTGQLALGVPAGVKMHSAVFATTPRSAGRLARAVLERRVREVQAAEVMDLDEIAYREGRVAPRLYGYLTVPHEGASVQGLKAASTGSEAAALHAIAAEVAERMAQDPERLHLVGPGTTTAAILRFLGLPGSLLGVDAVAGGRTVALDATERRLLQLLDGRPARIVVTVIGGQGYVLGRGNQQLSPAVLRAAGPGSLLVVATRGKLAALGGRPLLVDTGDPGLDRSLSGYLRVVTGWRDETVYRVEGG